MKVIVDGSERIRSFKEAGCVESGVKRAVSGRLKRAGKRERSMEGGGMLVGGDAVVGFDEEVVIGAAVVSEFGGSLRGISVVRGGKISHSVSPVLAAVSAAAIGRAGESEKSPQSLLMTASGTGCGCRGSDFEGTNDGQAVIGVPVSWCCRGSSGTFVDGTKSSANGFLSLKGGDSGAAMSGKDFLLSSNPSRPILAAPSLV